MSPRRATVFGVLGGSLVAMVLVGIAVEVRACLSSDEPLASRACGAAPDVVLDAGRALVCVRSWSKVR